MRREPRPDPLASQEAPWGEGIVPASPYAAVVGSLPPRLRLASGPWVFPLPAADESVLDAAESCPLEAIVVSDLDNLRRIAPEG